MRILGSPKELCNPVKHSGIVPVNHWGFCNGLHQSTRIEFTDNGLFYQSKPYCDCEKCKRFLFTNNKKTVGCIITVMFFLVYIWVMATPQGAIRRHLLVTDGVHAAALAEIRGNGEKRHLWNENIYMVTVDGEPEQWQVRTLQYNCFGRPVY